MTEFLIINSGFKSFSLAASTLLGFNLFKIKLTATRTKLTSAIDPQIMQEFANISGELGAITGSTDITGLVDTSFLAEIK